eukprot:TRINITY_DN24794_c0_g1_i1.p2 TRINITY_DN24794_c0_g1~~TRINITY_DN24794_c0_g1_i1.p2  ORF type:complete len:185 (-),score=51.96 TRINITY_DN24794_c0_g1_i1:340-894(-)
MTITEKTYLPEESELTVQEVPLGTPYLKAGAFHLGKVCEAENNEFMLCRIETGDPRACLKEGKEVTSCSLNFFKKIKATCASEFTAYAMCIERSSPQMRYAPCRKTQAAFDACVQENMNLSRPDYGYHCLPKIHHTDRPKPAEEKPAWMESSKHQKLAELPDDFPRKYQSWGAATPSRDHLGGL